MSEKKLNLFCQDLAFVLNGWEGGIKNKMLCFELLFWMESFLCGSKSRTWIVEETAGTEQKKSVFILNFSIILMKDRRDNLGLVFDC